MTTHEYNTNTNTNTNAKPNPHRLTVVFDFDGTITTKDTINVLFAFALARQKSTAGQDYTAAYNDILAKYSEDYTSHIQNYEPDAANRTDLKQEILFQRSLSDIEVRSFKRVSESGIFNGITREEWEEAGREAVRRREDVIIRPGFVELVRRMKKRDARCGIVSVNFSASFIRGVLSAALGKEDGGNIEILANCSGEDGRIKGPRIDEGKGHSSLVTTSGDKLSVMKKLLTEWKIRFDSNQNDTSVIYFGDSGTDIECLAEDGVIGVVISEDSESKLLKTMERIGVQVDSIKAYNGGEDRSREVFWARDFNDFIENPSFQIREYD
ncbi:hypothetical protein B7463_g9624, partial [Scytalidium lignicola]